MIQMTTLRYFRKAAPDGEANVNEWHAYREDSTTSACGEAQLQYNVDPIADVVPSDGVFHLGCREALAAETEAATDGGTYVPAESVEGTADGDAITADAVVEAPSVEAEPEAPAEVPEEAPAEEAPAEEAPAEEAPAEQPAEVIDGDDGTAATPEPDPAP